MIRGENNIKICELKVNDDNDRANIVKGLVFSGYKISIESRYDKTQYVQNHYIIVEEDEQQNDHLPLHNLAKPNIHNIDTSNYT